MISPTNSPDLIVGSGFRNHSLSLSLSLALSFSPHLSLCTHTLSLHALVLTRTARVEGLGFRVSGLEFGVTHPFLGNREDRGPEAPWFRVERFRVSGFQGFWVWDLVL